MDGSFRPDSKLLAPSAQRAPDPRRGTWAANLAIAMKSLHRNSIAHANGITTAAGSVTNIEGCRSSVQTENVVYLWESSRYTNNSIWARYP
jgi:hypothetical protein